jgi:hypothetical protein
MSNNKNWKRNKQYKQCSLERNEQQRQKGKKNNIMKLKKSTMKLKVQSGKKE